MGFGAYMNVANQRPAPITTYVTGVQCMYDGGDQGSELSLFNSATIQANSTLPGGQGQYIEAKNSGSCFFDSSTFSLKVEDATTSAIIGTVSFTDSGNNWTYTNTNTDVIDVYVNNSGDQAVITVTVENS